MKARVLIADDASFMRQMIREIIEPEGYEVVGEATDGVEAVEQYEQLQPDLVTMDIVMPKRSGIRGMSSSPHNSAFTCPFSISRSEPGLPRNVLW